MERIMIVDMLNMYYRAYIVDPSLSANGQPIGGIKGTLKILQKLLREVNPTKVYVCWDGREGSSKRRDTEYKEGRKPIRLNRDIRTMSDEQELQNKIWQQVRLVEYINNMPISQIMIDYTEADDVIATLCNFHKNENKIIVSSDKDFIQLLDDKTLLFRPVQKEIMNKKRVQEKFLIHPANFALARAICGDDSDNLGGVKGAGLKTLAKYFPDFLKEDSLTIDKLMETCENAENKLKIHEGILQNAELIQKNYKIMQLYTPSISTTTSGIIKNCVNNYPKELSKTNLRKMMIEDGFGEMNWEDLFSSLNKLQRG